MIGGHVDLNSTSLGAAGMVAQNYAALGSAVAAAGQNPSGATASAQSQADSLAQISVSVLKKALDIEATTAAQLTQMISQGAGINIQA